MKIGGVPVAGDIVKEVLPNQFAPENDKTGSPSCSFVCLSLY